MGWNKMREFRKVIGQLKTEGEYNRIADEMESRYGKRIY